MTSSVWAYATNTTRSARKHKYAESRAKEMQSHYDRGTWDIVPRTEATNKGCKVYRCSFVDKMKVLEDGTCKAKSRLVCNQSTGKSFRTDPKHEARTSPNRETFAGCAQMTSFRLLVALAAQFNLELFNGRRLLDRLLFSTPPPWRTSTWSSLRVTTRTAETSCANSASGSTEPNWPTEAGTLSSTPP